MVFLTCHEIPVPLRLTFRAGARIPAVFSATDMAVSFLQAKYGVKRDEASTVLIQLAEHIEQRLGLISIHPT